MKKMILTTITFIALCCTAPLVAQERGAKGERRGEPSPEAIEKFEKVKLDRLAEKLDLEGEVAERFKTLYRSYQEEGRQFMKRMDRRLFSGDVSAEKAEEAILNSFKTARESIDTREKYYYQFKEILTPQQIGEMYQFDHRLREELMDELKSRMRKGNRPKQK